MMTEPAARTTRPITTSPLGDDPGRVAGVLVAAWAEVRAGRRPLSQLEPLLSPAVHRRLAAQSPPHQAPAQHRVRIRKVIARRPQPAACEAVVVVESGTRVSAVAVRLERHLGRWRVVELTPPESGLTALPTASLPDGYRRRDAFDDEAMEHTARGARC